MQAHQLIKDIKQLKGTLRAINNINEIKIYIYCEFKDDTVSKARMERDQDQKDRSKAFKPWGGGGPLPASFQCLPYSLIYSLETNLVEATRRQIKSMENVCAIDESFAD